jgi:hypothetical protein
LSSHSSHRFCFWPLWVPCICLVLSLSHPRLVYRSLLIVLSLCGFGLFLYMIISLSINGQTISTTNGHIVYHLTLLSQSPYGVTVPYLLCTIVPFLFLPTVHLAWIFSLTVGVSAIASYIFYQQSFPSTWCFFSAWLSLQAISLRVYDICRDRSKDMVEPNITPPPSSSLSPSLCPTTTAVTEFTTEEPRLPEEI